MIIFLFLAVFLTTTGLLTFLTGLSYWFVPLWLVTGYISGMIFVVLTFIILAPFARLTSPFAKFKHAYAKSLSTFLNCFVFRIKVKEVIGKENILKDESLVVYSNHKSAIDGFIIKAKINKPMGFAAKDSIFKVPIVKSWLKGIGSLNINRENNREALKEILKGAELIKKGLSMAIFPEGTRSSRKTSLMINNRPGAYKLVTKTEATILPIAISGTRHIKVRRLFQRIKVVLIIGKPIYYEQIKDLNTVQIGDLVFDTVNQMLTDYEN